MADGFAQLLAAIDIKKTPPGEATEGHVSVSPDKNLSEVMTEESTIKRPAADDYEAASSGKRFRQSPPVPSLADSSSHASVKIESVQFNGEESAVNLSPPTGEEINEPCKPRVPRPHLHLDLSTPRRQLFREIARKDVPKSYRAFTNGYRTMLRNAFVASASCAKEIKKRTLESKRRAKDSQLKSKKIMREMFTYWRKHDKEARDGYKRNVVRGKSMSSKKQESEIREAQRQKRKYNYLIAQTELYAHFMQNKKGQSASEFAKGQASILAKTIETGSALDSSGSGYGGADNGVRNRLMATANNAHAARTAALKQFEANAKRQKGSTKFDDKNSMQQTFDSSFNLGHKPEFEGDGISQPDLFKGQLNGYQLTGLRWLVNLYDNGINGILADEMGLGKTVQSIAALAHIAEVQNEWGPFLIISPASTLNQWVEEFSKFVPEFKVLPYWGTPAERSILRREFSSKTLGVRESQFHVVVTSYQFAVVDEKYFARTSWQVMVMDEAQFLKNSASERWRALLRFSCKNRILLTGTPIQNTMAELWSLLHIIMPSLFDSHSEFNEWFSKDIESKAANKSSSLNSEQLSRLHKILKPFMLRRVKSDVAHELPKKIEVQVNCTMSIRQRRLYDELKGQISVNELANATDFDKILRTKLNNLLMQFRKVCNHPELVIRRTTKSPLVFVLESVLPPVFENDEAGKVIQDDVLDVSYSCGSTIEYYCPRLIFRELVIQRREHGCLGHIPWLCRTHGIFQTEHIHRSLFPKDLEDRGDKFHSTSTFSFLRFVNTSVEWVSEYAQSNNVEKILLQQLAICHASCRSPFTDSANSQLSLDIRLNDKNKSLHFENTTREVVLLLRLARVHVIRAISPPISANVAGEFGNVDAVKLGSFWNWRLLLSASMPTGFVNCKFIERKQLVTVALEDTKRASSICSPLAEMMPLVDFEYVSHTKQSTVLFDADKMRRLDELLVKLKAGDHRVLIYSQMTKMLDLIEEFLLYRKYGFLRLDGSTKLDDRRDMVADFQSRSDVFVFLLSTRAGGLGLNLTSADTVIFYDSDWNPTVDQQAMDRTHRLGQRKQVTVYRLVTKGTIEERILRRACQKSAIQSMVMTGSTGSENDLKSNDVVSLLLDDDDMKAKVESEKEKLRTAEKAALEEKTRRDNERRRLRRKLQQEYKRNERTLGASFQVMQSSEDAVEAAQSILSSAGVKVD